MTRYASLGRAEYRSQQVTTIRADLAMPFWEPGQGILRFKLVSLVVGQFGLRLRGSMSEKFFFGIVAT